MALAAASSLGARAQTSAYFPPRGEWAHRTPSELGIDSARLQKAIDFSVANENRANRDLAAYLNHTLLPVEPTFRLLGPTQPRGDLTGLVIYRGYVAAAWGQPDRVDMTFSATKTFLTTVVGLAWQRGLIRNLGDRASGYMPTPELFASEHNSKITWEHMLRQSSDWLGTLWGVADAAAADLPVPTRPEDLTAGRSTSPARSSTTTMCG